MPIPRLALILTWAGMLPFLGGAALRLLPAPEAPGYLGLLYPTDAIAILAGYALIIFAFMSGVLWGLASNGPEPARALPYALAVTPAIAAFFLGVEHLLGAPSNRDALFWLMLGFPALLLLDGWFYRAGLAPDWWLRLRLPPTVVATAACAIGWAA